ncbi:DUF7010 family protein [Lysobacter humi (ex Lee et al. 2017)]
MPEPRANGVAPLGEARMRLARITRRGAGMTLAAAAYWAALAGVIVAARPEAPTRALLFVLGGALAYPIGYAVNRALGGDLTARGSAFRGLVGAITASQALGWPVVLVLLLRVPALVPLAIAALMGAHYLPYAWLYRAPAYAALGIVSVAAATTAELVWPGRADLMIAATLALLHAVAGLRVARMRDLPAA